MIKIDKIYDKFSQNSEDISFQTNTWPFSNTECKKWAKYAKLSFSRVFIIKSKMSRTNLHPIFIKMDKTKYIKTINVNSKLIIRCEN